MSAVSLEKDLKTASGKTAEELLTSLDSKLSSPVAHPHTSGEVQVLFEQARECAHSMEEWGNDYKERISSIMQTLGGLAYHVNEASKYGVYFHKSYLFALQIWQLLGNWISLYLNRVLLSPFFFMYGHANTLVSNYINILYTRYLPFYGGNHAELNEGLSAIDKLQKIEEQKVKMDRERFKSVSALKPKKESALSGAASLEGEPTEVEEYTDDDGEEILHGAHKDFDEEEGRSTEQAFTFANRDLGRVAFVQLAPEAMNTTEGRLTALRQMPDLPVPPPLPDWDEAQKQVEQLRTDTEMLERKLRLIKRHKNLTVEELGAKLGIQNLVQAGELAAAAPGSSDWLWRGFEQLDNLQESFAMTGDGVADVMDRQAHMIVDSRCVYMRIEELMHAGVQVHPRIWPWIKQQRWAAEGVSELFMHLQTSPTLGWAWFKHLLRDLSAYVALRSQLHMEMMTMKFGLHYNKPIYEKILESPLA